MNEEILIVNAGGPRGMRASFTAAFEKFDEEWHVIWKANLLSIAPVFPLFFLGEPVSGLVATMASASLFALAFVWLILRALLQSDWIVAGLRNMSRPVRPIMTFRFNLWDWRRELRLLYGLAAIGSLALIFSKGLVQSIDFEAGTEVTLQADRQFDQGQLERAASDYFKRRSTVRTLEGGGAPTFLFLVPGFGPNTQGQSRYAITVDGLVTHLNSTLPARFEQKSANSAGANVTGISLRAFLICALIGISSLLAFLLSLYRFRVAFAIVVAMLLDATVALGALSLTSVPLSLPILSSLLAIVGYSVYDSVVIAEHLKGDLVSRANRNRAADDVVAETLGKLTRRFVLTVTSTALSALSIAFFCRGLLQDFGIVMAAGAAFGMMSTIAIVVVSVKSAYGRPAGLDSELAVTA